MNEYIYLLVSGFVAWWLVPILLFLLKDNFKSTTGFFTCCASFMVSSVLLFISRLFRYPSLYTMNQLSVLVVYFSLVFFWYYCIIQFFIERWVFLDIFYYTTLYTILGGVIWGLALTGNYYLQT